MNWVIIFLGFSLLIVLHEGGHFVVAKATGMRVERFFLFFGPTLWSFKRGETEYGVKAIPLGGFVKITGMNPEEELPPEVEPRAYYRQPVWKRIVVIGAGPAVNIALAFAILFAILLGANKTTLGVLDATGTLDAVEPTQMVGEIRRDTPAAEALRRGDEIIAIDGRSYPKLGFEQRLDKFIDRVAMHRCAGRQKKGCLAATPVKLAVRRDGRLRTISVRPEYDPAVDRTRIGFGYDFEGKDFGVGGAARGSAEVMWSVTSRTVTVFARLFEEENRKQVSGIVGVSDAANRTIDVSAQRSLLLLALVSLSLGLINLFPFLPLDGGHIFWSLVEKVRGRPVPLRTMERAGALGFVLVIMLFVIGLSNDIGRLTGEGFDVR